MKQIIGQIPQNAIWIDNEWVFPESVETYEIINPSNGEVISTCVKTNSKYVDMAVASSHKAFHNPEWNHINPRERGRILYRLSEILERRKEEFAYIESLNNGKPLSEARSVDIPSAINMYEYYAGWTTKYGSEVIPVNGPYLNYTLRQPVGVVGAIIPWNFPFLMAAWKLAPALATGNTVILKPSEQTPLSALLLMECLKEAGLPKGVVNLVTGFGETGELITRHPLVNKIAFTGSRTVASKILHASAETNLKRVSLELGGKSPNIVFPDADIDKVVDAVFWGIYANKGEVCAAGSRLIIHKDIKDVVLDRLCNKAKKLKIGNPLDPDTQIGSLISRKQLERVESYAKSGIEQGARLVTGGKRVTNEPFDKGFFFEPTIFDNVTCDMKIAQEEIFGPVLAVIEFTSEEEAIQIANSTIYGLVSAVWTKDVSKALAIAEKINSGTVWINHYNNFDPASPFGGFNESGWGREMGFYALELYTEIKSIWVPISRSNRTL